MLCFSPALPLSLPNRRLHKGFEGFFGMGHFSLYTKIPEMVTEGAFDPTPPEPHTAIRHTRVDRKAKQEKGVSRARPEAPA